MNKQLLNPPSIADNGRFSLLFPVFLSTESFSVESRSDTGRCVFTEILEVCPLFKLVEIGDELVSIGGSSGDICLVENSKDLCQLLRDSPSREVVLRRPSRDIRQKSKMCVIS